MIAELEFQVKQVNFQRKQRALDKREYLIIIFLNFFQTICCDQRDSSVEGSQHMFLCRINKVVQIRGVIADNSKIIFHISEQKHML